MDAIEKLNLNLLGILETHVHADHITAAYKIRKKTGVFIYYGSESGVDGADVLLKDGDVIQVGSNKSRPYPKKIDIAVPANMKCGRTSKS